MLEHYGPVYTFPPGPGLLRRQPILLQYVEEYWIPDELHRVLRSGGFGSICCDLGGRQRYEGGWLEDSVAVVDRCCGGAAYRYDSGSK